MGTEEMIIDMCFCYSMIEIHNSIFKNFRGFAPIQKLNFSSRNRSGCKVREDFHRFSFFFRSEWHSCNPSGSERYKVHPCSSTVTAHRTFFHTERSRLMWFFPLFWLLPFWSVSCTFELWPYSFVIHSAHGGGGCWQRDRPARYGAVAA